MAKSREFRWKIDAFTAETMPLDRLAEYMTHLAKMLGDPKHLHLIRVETGSTVPVLRVDHEAVDSVRRRARAIRSGHAPKETLGAYRRLNHMLREDRADAILYDGEAEIIPFPGQNEADESISGVAQQGSLDGVLQKVGGPNDWVPVQLRTMDETNITRCVAKRTLAKQLANHLFDPVRLYGRGRWTRTIDGFWTLDSFKVDTFEELSDEPLPSVISKLRNIKSDWVDNPVADILGDAAEQ